MTTIETIRQHKKAADASPSRRELLSFAPASFGGGTTDYGIMGLLPPVATDLSASRPRGGLHVTYALSVAFESPFLAIATARLAVVDGDFEVEQIR